MERQSRFAYLLEPIRDLTKNWEVDVARQLDDYLSEIAEITISFDGGATQLNFAEAALLIQGSACIYSRKVEYLHALVYQTLDLISSNRKLAHGSSVDDQGRDRDVSFAVCRAEEELVVLDGLPVTANVKNTLDTDLTVATTVPRTPLSLTPLQESDRVNSTPLLSRTGELLGSKVDFKMNTGSVHLSGNLILEPVDQQMVITVTRRGGAEPVTITSTTPAAAITSMLSCGGGGASGVDMDTSDAGPAVLDDSGVCEGVDLGASPVLGLPNQSPSQCQNPNPSVRKKQARVVEKKMSDPLQPLDPHAENLNDCKPVKRGVAHRLPAALKTSSEGTRRRNRKRNVGTTPPKTETLAEFIHKSLYSCSSLFPKTYLKAPLSAEFEGLYWAEQKRLKEQRAKDKRRLRALLSSERSKADAVEDEDTYQPLGQADVSDAEDVAAAVTSAERDEEHFEAVFERFHDVPASSFQGVEPMALEEGAQPSTTPGSSHRCNYEDLVQEYVESTTKRAAVYANDTDLSKRVLEWERKIVPTLDEEETHPVFDIHQCGTKVIDTFKDNDSSVLDFHQLAVGKEHYEICRYFAATLQLANDGNVEIASEETMDVIGLRLLSTHRNFENVSSYGPSSSH